MAGKIPQYFIDDMLDRVDIVDVVNARVQLKKTGKNYSACCPFHDEKTPSFTVSPDKQFYYCFGCKASGTAINFVMEYDRMSFPEAIEQLAGDFGMEVPREETTPLQDERARRKKQLMTLVDKADQFYRQQLRQHSAAGNVVNYLKERGLSGQIAASFGIGFAPPGWENLLKHLGDDSNSIKLQEEGGLLIVREDESKRYDRFRNRIMFPIRDTRGRTIAFGGRVVGDDKPKYLNSPETPLFHKGRELYGLYEANQAQKELTEVLVVEGYMDVVALAQYGITNAVATLGTAITPAHLEKLFRYTPEVVFCFDGDFAGVQAAHRALQNTLPEMTDGRSAKFLFLPEGEDPDSLVRKIGEENFRDQVKGAEPLSQFLFRVVSEGLDISTPDGQARLTKAAAPHINTIPPGFFRELMINELAKLTGLDASKLDTLISNSEAPATAPEPAAQAPAQAQEATPESQPQSQPQQNELPPADDHAPDMPHASYPAYDEPAHYGENAHPGYDYEEEQAGTPSSSYNIQRVSVTPERTLTAILLNHPEYGAHIDCLNELQQLDSEDGQRLVSLVTMLHQEPELNFYQILGRWQSKHSTDEMKAITSIASSELMTAPDGSKRDNLAEFRDALANLRQLAFEKMPLLEQVASLLNREQLQERDFKAALKILPLALASDLPEEQKNQLKQLVVTRKRS